MAPIGEGPIGEGPISEEPFHPDDPPFSRRRLAALTVALLAWQPAVFPAQVGARIAPLTEAAPVVTDSITVGTFPATLNAILATWQTEVRALPPRVFAPPVEATPAADTVPAGTFPSTLNAILTAWQAPPFLGPLTGAHAPLVATAVAVNDPPFGQRPSLPLIIGSWQPPAPPPVHVIVVPPETPTPPAGGAILFQTRRWSFHRSGDA